MNNTNLEEYVDVLEILINHYNSNDTHLLSHPTLRDSYGYGERNSDDYEQRKRSFERCLNFFSQIKLLTIYTDTTQNEIDRLGRVRIYRYTPLDERKQLDPYIQYIKDERKSNTYKITLNDGSEVDDICKKFNMVRKYIKTVEMWVDGDNDEVDENILKQLPKYIDEEKNPLKEYPTQKGYHIINDRLKLKRVEKERLTIEFFGEKFQNITTDMESDFTDKDGNVRNLSDDTVFIDSKTIGIVDFDDINVRVDDCLYRLNKKDNCIENNPIEFNLPSNTKVDLFVKFLMKNIDKKQNEDEELNEDLTDPFISSVVNSNAFGDNKGFVSQTIGKLILFNHNNMNINNKTEGYYPLGVLIQIIESGNSIDIEFENFGNNLILQNTTIKKIVVNENSFDLHFDNFVSQNHTDISQIKKIDNHSEDGFRNDVDKVIELINGLDGKYKEYFEKEFDDLIKSFDVMVF
ncbi:hypothetical protein ACN9JU_01940 [Aliarcobacter butzleri]|uniref:hypothetical protein n=1 Tax=Aliarcobacter butzleri TaxID=28197 RepID=UPI003B22857E